MNSLSQGLFLSQAEEEEPAPRRKKAKKNAPAVEPKPENLIEHTEFYNVAKLIYIIRHYEALGLGGIKTPHEKLSTQASILMFEELVSKIEMTPEQWPYGKQKVTYEQSSLGFGRYTSKSLSYIFMSRKIRHTVADHLYADLDFVNCHPTIYVQLCHFYHLPLAVYEHLEEYIENRDAHFEAAMTLNPNIVRDDIKAWFLKLLNGGLANEDNDSMRFTSFMKEYSERMPKLHEALVKKIEADARYKNNRNYVYEKEGPRAYNVDCKVISYVLFDFEDRMRNALAKYVKNEGFDWSVECYDGGMSYLPYNRQNIFQKLDLEAAAEHVQLDSAVPCSIKIKGMNEGLALPMDQIKALTYKDFLEYKFRFGKNYESVKFRFEKNNFFASHEVAYYEEDSQNVRMYTKQEFVNKYENLVYEEWDNKTQSFKKMKFIMAWMCDPDKRTYKIVGLFPPGSDKPVNPEDKDDTAYYYSKWKGFRAQHIIPDGNDYSAQVEKLRDHTLYLVNGNESYRDYLERYIKHILVYPGRKTDMVIALKAVQGGEGKNTWWEIHKELFGSQYCASTQNHERDWFGDFNEFIADKLWLHMEEMSKETLRKYQKQFLAYVTSKIDPINYKGGKKRQVPSFCNYFVTFNTQGVDMFPGLKRRLWINELGKDTPIKNREYYDELYAIMKSGQVIRAYYDWLMENVNIDQYKPSDERPETDYMVRLWNKEDNNRDRFEQFVQELVINCFNDRFLCPGVEYKTLLSTLYQDYVRRLKEEGASQYICTNHRFSGRLGETFKEEDGLSRSYVKGVLQYVFKIDQLIDTMVKKSWMRWEDLGHSVEYMDMSYRVVSPHRRGCDRVKNLAHQAHKLNSEISAYGFFRNFERPEYQYDCECGAHIVLRHIPSFQNS